MATNRLCTIVYMATVGKNFHKRVCILSCQKRTFMSKDIRVRFAPSPTGYLHLGGLRTALYNYLFAKSHNGKFILRIEDTDQTRLVKGAADKLQKDLIWAGIQIDEGPSNEGNYGPYIQSKRLNLYKEQVQILLNNKSAYYCFCNDKRLDLLRKEALRMRQVPKYDNRCRHLKPEDVHKYLSRGDKYCIRFKLLPDCETFEDMIYGNIAYDVALNEGDPVIMKSDKYPTYHFANVVDDHFMNITHVLRGVEWQISTTKHILMYRAFNWEPPKFGHLPLLMNADGTKLSKRQGDIQISNYRKNGIFPQALINFVISCGGGFHKEQGLKEKCYSMDELIQQFDINRVNAHSTKLAPEKLEEYNRLELGNLLVNEDNCNKLIVDVQEMLKNKFPDKVAINRIQLNESYIKSILLWSSSRINRISDLISNDLLFLWIIPQPNTVLNEEEVKLIQSLHNIFNNENITYRKDNIKEFLKQFATNNNIAFSKLMKLMRSVLSGLKEGPGVAEMIEILGKKNTVLRMTEYIRKHSS